ncbi:MAG: hypothetical protein K0B11_22315 [Mariniphaga sp.]|nr:hypothetical protein [Mariniphaga sp.]
MFSSQNNKSDIILAIYSDNRTVYRLKDVAMLTGETRLPSLSKKLNYNVKTGKLQNPRKGIYTKPDYNQEEMACTVFTPSYISLEYVLQKAGIVFQYDSRITVISYLSRNIEIDGQAYLYRKLKNELLINTEGIDRKPNQINIAKPERAFLDILYLNKEYYFDNLNPLNKELIYKLLPLFQSKILEQKAGKYL